jgi:hypothetical protein
MPDGSQFNPASELAHSDATLIANGYEPVAVEGKRANLLFYRIRSSSAQLTRMRSCPISARAPAKPASTSASETQLRPKRNRSYR